MKKNNDKNMEGVLNKINEGNNEVYNKIEENNIKKDKEKNRKQEVLMFIKFLLFSLSVGIIQIGSFELLYHIIGWNNWWATYLISIVLSVIWNFTFNRKFTFKSANNIPKAMSLVLCYYVVFIPISVFGGQALENLGWHGTIVTLLMMVINFITEFLFDRYVVFKNSLNTK